jgi:hypothetical protein
MFITVVCNLLQNKVSKKYKNLEITRYPNISPHPAEGLRIKYFQNKKVFINKSNLRNTASYKF